MNLILEHLKKISKCDSPQEITIVADGATATFKNRYQFQETVVWSNDKYLIYSVTGHGKEACDGIGSLVKHYAS